MIAGGAMLGPDQPVILHLLDIEPVAEILEAVKTELMDGAFPLLKGVIATTDVVESCQDVDIAIMLGGFPRTKGDSKDMIFKNVEFAPSIPEENITSLTRLDHNRALSQISENRNVHVGDVKNPIIWGNHSFTLYPDANHATVDTGVRHKPVRELTTDDQWLNTEFITNVEQRDQAIIKARGLSSAFSTASVACDHMHDWILGTPKGTWVSIGVYSDGSYGIQPGLIYSFLVTCHMSCEKAVWSIVQGLKIDEFAREKMDVVARELIEEKRVAYSCLQ
ncbi:hypothetical protein SSX86_016784 [Deinandra increscens subsp. villosa]|uniref:Lactate/malate dehydrogenase C-terminal domain-containing protein n=1 Tax=Deinandra increscens subsp. villosa TaxID=3103831 RepID=A0AAP0GXJ6_9ASTR